MQQLQVDTNVNYGQVNTADGGYRDTEAKHDVA